MDDLSYAILSGVVDVAEGHVYVQNVDGLIECLSFDTGAVEARSNRTGLPVATGTGVVIGWAPAVDQTGVEIFALERSGKTLTERWTRRLDLPDWVDVDSEEAGRFTVAASPPDDGAVSVRWKAIARYDGGAPPSPDVEDAAAQAANGHVRFSTDTGDDQSATTRTTNAPQPVPPAIASPDRLMSYRYRADRETQPWTHGSVDHFLVVRSGAPGISMVTVDGSDHRETSITSDPAADVMVTIDGSLILVHEPSSDASVWRAITAATGKPAGTVPFADGIMAAVRVDERLISETHREIGGADQHVVSAVELDSDRPIWTHVLGESAPSTAPPLQP